MRAQSLLASYRLFTTEGGEGPQIYAIWRVVHGHPLYTWPQHEPFALTLYNFLFYESYGAILRLLGLDGETLLLAGRLVTIAFAGVGATVYGALLFDLLPDRLRTRGGRTTVYLFALFMWLGTNFASWWPLSIRPDVPGAVFAVAGLALVLRARRRPRGTWLLVGASVCFFAAWAFKQTLGLTLAGCTVFLLFSPQERRRLVPLLVPFGALAGLALGLGGGAYRFSILQAGAAGHLLPGQALAIFARVFLQNAFIWVFPVVGWWLGQQRDLAPRASLGEGASSERGLLWTVLGVTAAGGMVLLSRESANENQLMEAYLAAGICAASGFARAVAGAHGRARAVALAVAAGLCLPMLAFPVAQIAWPNRYGVTRLSSAASRDTKLHLAEQMRGMPKPILILDDVLAQPWHSTDGAYPALVLDRAWTWLARRDSLLPPGIAEEIVMRGGFRTVIGEEDGEFVRLAQAAGFLCGPLPIGTPDAFSLAACSRGR